MLDADACYTALCARDERFDGVFYVGVETTGIYCRPICPARTPGKTRCRFFARPLEAEREGFRACFRCRPEIAPGGAPVDSLSRLTADAIHRIDAGYLNEQGVDDLAAELGVTGRHLRRAMQSELGISPIDLAQARRLSLAKQLLHDSELTITEVALVAGFASLRRFNAAFLAHFGCNPTALKKATRVDAGPKTPRRAPISLRLDYAAPYDWDNVVAFLEGRAILRVESIHDGVYRRTVRTNDGGGWLSVTPERRRSLRVDLHLTPSAEIGGIIARVRRLFDLDARPQAISEHLAKDDRLSALVAQKPGLRVPGAFDGFELAVRAILGQQVTVRAATTLSGRLVAALGDPIETGVDGLTALFPTPGTVAAAPLLTIIKVGMPEKRAAAIRTLAAAAAAGTIPLAPCSDPEAAVEALQALPGIGSWTAHYIAMRALRWPDAFPAGDLAVRKALGVTTSRDAERLAEPLRPWRSYAVMHLWASLSSGG